MLQLKKAVCMHRDVALYRLCDEFSGPVSPTNTTWYQETWGRERRVQWSRWSGRWCLMKVDKVSAHRSTCLPIRETASQRRSATPSDSASTNTSASGSSPTSWCRSIRCRSAMTPTGWRECLTLSRSRRSHTCSFTVGQPLSSSTGSTGCKRICPLLSIGFRCLPIVLV